MMPASLIHIEKLTLAYPGKMLYENLRFDLYRGDCIMLCGANGSGKTSLLRALANAETETVLIPTKIPKIPGFTLQDFIRISCYRQSDRTGRLSAHDRKVMQYAMERLGIAHLKDRDISTLSDGEFQKGCIATAIVRHAELILLDEPTAFLDPQNRKSVLHTLRSLCMEANPPAIIFSTHDLADGLEACNRVIALGRQFTITPPESDKATLRLATENIF